MSWPYGALTKEEFNNVPLGAMFYGVWRAEGAIHKYWKEVGPEATLTSDPDTWCSGAPGYYPPDKYCRRAFLNYWHAYAYSLKIKMARLAERKLRDQQKVDQEVS